MPRVHKTKSPRKVWVFLLLLIGIVAIGVLVVSRQHAPNKSAGISRQPFHPAPDLDDKAVFSAYGGSANCKSCHESEFKLWQGSHHGLAERAIDPQLDALAFERQPAIKHGSQE